MIWQSDITEHWSVSGTIFDARSLALFSDVYLSNVIDTEPHLAMGDHYLAYS